MSDWVSIERPIQLAASDRRPGASTEAMLARLLFMSEMPASWLNWAICATIWVLSTGLNGSWVLSWVVISRRKSLWSIAPEGLVAIVTPGRAALVGIGLLVAVVVVIGRASKCRASGSLRSAGPGRCSDIGGRSRPYR